MIHLSTSASDFVTLAASLRYLDERSDRWNTCAIYDKQHVIARGGKICVGRRSQSESSGSLRKAQRHKALVLIEEVSDSAGSDQNSARNRRAVRSTYKKIRTILDLAGRLTDRWPGAFEEIRRRVKLRALLVGYISKISAHPRLQHPAVGQK